MSELKLVDVAVAVIMKPDGEFLLARRPAGKPYEGYWEFPGGKVEMGETVYDALVREIREELGIEVLQAYPWITQIFTYPHATVKLHFYRITQWQGTPYPHENQEFSWQYSNQVSVAPLLPANGPVLKALSLPAIYGISRASEVGRVAFLEQLEVAFERGLRIVQIREKQMPQDELVTFVSEVMSISRCYDGTVLVNGDVALAEKTGADGVHLTSRQLMNTQTRPDFRWAGASCHTRKELEHAASLGMDYALLGPVKPTLTHPEASGLGWQVFADMVGELSIPVYALGGVVRQDLISAWTYGAHGIAMLRGAWKPEE